MTTVRILSWRSLAWKRTKGKNDLVVNDIQPKSRGRVLPSAPRGGSKTRVTSALQHSINEIGKYAMWKQGSDEIKPDQTFESVEVG